ncbi:LCI fold-containing protein [Neobacillus paridis]
MPSTGVYRNSFDHDDIPFYFIMIFYRNSIIQKYKIKGTPRK